MSISSLYFIPKMPPNLEALPELALNMRWSWDHSMDFLWQRLDQELWEQTRNPWLILLSCSESQLLELSEDASFVQALADVANAQRSALSCDCWFHGTDSAKSVSGIAYFCMEFGLSEALPLYSGGLGILAGDSLKTASDLGIPVTGIGILYQQGYFRQVFDPSGAQREIYPYNDPIQLPVFPLRDKQGEWLHVLVPLPGRQLRLRVWRALVGRVELLLLDSNDPRNRPSDRGITSELYGGSQEIRLQQEMILGIGGCRVLQRLDLKPEVFHLNEGHAAFAALERAFQFGDSTGCSFDVALTATRVGNLFTTHTPVAAAFDRFPDSLVEYHLSAYAEEIGVSIERVLELGRMDATSRDFNMTWLAIHGSGSVNAVSQIHQRVSRGILSPLFPRWPQSELPIGCVTNGVHVPSWDSIESDALWTRACGKDRWLNDLEANEQAIRALSDEDLWSLRSCSRRQLVDYSRNRLASLLGSADATLDVLDPNALTLCFARRFTDYKRPDLLLSNPDRLLQLLRDDQRPLQILIAGKAHPKDEAGKSMIRRWNEFIDAHQLTRKVVFLPDYDIRLAEQLVAGADVWVNTPRRPWEACGTSGMKILANGGLNLSELDGWWAQAYAAEYGWGVLAPPDGADAETVDRKEAELIYRMLSEDVIPCFYHRDSGGIPRDWVALMRSSIAELTPRFSANRMMRQYVQDHYLGLAQQYRKRTSDGGQLALAIELWHSDVSHHWSMLHFGELEILEDGNARLFKLPIYLDELNQEAIRVELFADGTDDRPREVHPMDPISALTGAVNGFLYQCMLPLGRPASDYTARLIPYHPDVSVPLEAQQILWQH